MKILSTCSLALLFAAACQSPKPALPPEPTGKVPPPPAAWTRAFEKASIVIANRIEIVGPPGLRDHLALRTEGEQHRQVVETTSEGLRQQITRANASVEAEIRAYIDRWQLVAIDELRVLERPSTCDVRILAIGDVLFVDESTHQERRAQQLEFHGPVGK